MSGDGDMLWCAGSPHALGWAVARADEERPVRPEHRQSLDVLLGARWIRQKPWRRAKRAVLNKTGRGGGGSGIDGRSNPPMCYARRKYNLLARVVDVVATAAQRGAASTQRALQREVGVRFGRSVQAHNTARTRDGVERRDGRVGEPGCLTVPWADWQRQAAEMAG